MKILIDEAFRGEQWKPLVERLKKEHDAISVLDETNKLRGKEDAELGLWASENKRHVITIDKSSFLRDNVEANQDLPYGVTTLRLNKLSPEARAERVSQFIEQHREKLHGKSVILEPNTERIKTIEQVKKEVKSEDKELTSEERQVENIKAREVLKTAGAHAVKSSVDQVPDQEVDKALRPVMASKEHVIKIDGKECSIKLKTAMTKEEFEQKLKDPVFKKQVTEGAKQDKRVQNSEQVQHKPVEPPKQKL